MNLAYGTLVLGALGLVFGPLTTPERAQGRPEAQAETQTRELDLRDVASYAKISLLDAMKSAAQKQQGTVVEAGLEGEGRGKKRQVFFEIMILDRESTLHELKVDPASGTVLSSSAEDDQEEVREFKAAIRNGEISLAQSIEKAMAIIKGKPLTASLEMEEHGPECAVVLLNSRYLIEASIETRAGHLVDLELEQNSNEEADDEAKRNEGDEEEGHEEEGHEEKGEGEEEEIEEHKKG